MTTPSTTLLSLAILKATVNDNQDYLSYLIPYVQQILSDTNNSFTDEYVTNEIRELYGLVIPERTVKLVLNKFKKKNFIEENNREYHIKKSIPDPDIEKEKSAATRHINSAVTGLIEFAQEQNRPLNGEDEAINLLYSFLEEFQIPCLRAYLGKSTIPEFTGSIGEQAKQLVGQYVLHINSNDPARFESFMVLVTGNMYANALLCPDLQDAPKNYSKVTFYFDTPLVLQALGLEGEMPQKSMNELLSLLQRLQAKIAIFRHTRDEVENVINQVAENMDKPDRWMSGVMTEVIRSNVKKSDLILMVESMTEELEKIGIKSKMTPPYKEEFQISEQELESILEEKVNYSNPNAIQYDIKSVRSVYVLRANKQISKLEDCVAVLVTSNSSYAYAADEYGKKHNELKEVSSVITNFSLVNIAWLKLPMEAPNLPKAELLAIAYAAQKPSAKKLKKYIEYVDVLEENKRASVGDLAILRSAPAADELAKLPFVNENFTDEDINLVLERAKDTMLIDANREKEIVEKDRDSQTAKIKKWESAVRAKCKQKAKHLRCCLDIVIILMVIILVLVFIVPLFLPTDNFMHSLRNTSAIFLTLFTTLWGGGVWTWFICRRKIECWIFNRCYSQWTNLLE